MTLDELNAQIMVAPFVELEPHIKRGAVLIIDESLDIATVGLQLANDDKTAISDLLQQHLLIKASGVNFEGWRREKKFFRILIIQPFVLVQDFVTLSPAPAN